MHRAVGGSSRTSRSLLHSVSAAVAIRFTTVEMLVFTLLLVSTKRSRKNHGSMPHASRIHRRTLGIGMFCRHGDFGITCLGVQSALDRVATSTFILNGYFEPIF